MQLHVTMNDADSNGDPLEFTVNQFDDLDKIAARVARRVKAFLRAVPVRKQFSRARFDVTAYYTETAAAVPKKRKARARKAAEVASAA